MNLLLLNGPNLNLLGTREPSQYGRVTLEALTRELTAWLAVRGVGLRAVQSNHEGVLVDAVQGAAADCAGIVINPGAYGHTSVALRDALLAVGLPVALVHLTNLARREAFRATDLIADVAIGQVAGFGAVGYRLACEALLHHLDHPPSP